MKGSELFHYVINELVFAKAKFPVKAEVLQREGLHFCTGGPLRSKTFVDDLAVQTKLRHKKFLRSSQKGCCS